MTRYMAAADYAIRQVLSVKLVQPPTAVTRHYGARPAHPHLEVHA